MKNRYLILLFSFLLVQAKAQVATNYSAKWFIGFNTGATWNTADVKTQVNSGWGLYLGRSFNYNYGRIASFDLRTRFLKGWWYGQDITATDSTFANSVLGSDPTNYYDSLGFAVNNFQTETYRWSLELALHFNRMRENSRIDPYIFGGIGLTWHQTYGDLLYTDTISGGQNLYQYDANDLSKSTVKKLRDGVYETALVGSDQEKFNLNVMPSLGFGIGYQLGKGTTIGFEHKTTFTGIDTYDGVVKDGKYAQDIYHYSNLYIQFRLGKDKYKEEPQSFYPPEVDFTKPAADRTEVTDSIYQLEAIVKHVEDKEGLTFLANGRNNTAYYFSGNNDRFTAQERLQEGVNTFILVGVNNFGQDADTVILTYKKKIVNDVVRQLPVVDYINPGTDPLTVHNPNYTVIAKVYHVDNKADITVRFRNNIVTNFSFNVQNKEVKFPVSLQFGANEVEITGVNKDGSDVERTTIVYERTQTVNPPSVRFTNPSASGRSVNSPNYQVVGQLSHVNAKDRVRFKQNGNDQANFQYNAATGVFSADVYLIPGNNVFELYGTNESGTASDQTVIIYQRSSPKPPVVTIQNPSQNNATTSNQTFNFVGRVLNVTNVNQVQLTWNGNTISNFSFDPNTGDVRYTVQLISGNNSFELRGTNSDGTDSKDANVLYRPSSSLQPPVVNFVNPSINPENVSSSGYTVKATVTNVSSNSGLLVRVNGQVVTNYTFSGQNLTLPLTLVRGANVIFVQGTNAAGTDSKETAIYYQKVPTENPPLVTYLNPSVNPTTVSTAGYLLKARVDEISTASQIEVKYNGTVTSSFAFSSSSHELMMNVNLVEGSNVFEIKATNSAGSDMKSTVVIYRPFEKNPPVVDITEPQQNPYSVQVSSFVLKANVENVQNKNQIVFKVNGSPTSGFTFDASTGQIQSNVYLQEGNNTVQILATNEDGTDSDETTLIYKKPAVVNPPSIVYTNPNQPNTEVNNSAFVLEAKVLNVDSKNQISLKVNGLEVASNSYNFDLNAKVLTYAMTLIEGSNVFHIQASNEGGTVDNTTNILYKKPQEPCEGPKFSFVTPSASGQKTTAGTYTLKFTSLSKSKLTNLTVKLNGSPIGVQSSGSTYTANLNLIKGNNIVEVFGKNSCDQTIVNTTIVYEPNDVPCSMPGLTVVSPRQRDFATYEDQVTLEMGASNVSSTEISLTLNGNPIAFNFDNVSHVVKVQANLSLGRNVFLLKAKNSCGEKQLERIITKEVCKEPTLNLAATNAPNNTQTTNRSFELDVKANEITLKSQIEVTLNNKPVAFTYSESTGIISIRQILNMGVAKFKISGQNNCGTAIYNHTVTVVKSTDKPPTVSFVNPASTSQTVSNAGYLAKMKTANVMLAEKIIFKLNGVSLPVQFDFNQQEATVQLNLNPGNNQLEVTVVNDAGSASASCEINYVLSVQLRKPVIRMDGTYGPTNKVAPGNIRIHGVAQNITDIKNVTIIVNNKEYTRVSKKIARGGVDFDFRVNMEAGKTYRVIIKGEQNGQKVTETLQFEVNATSTPTPRPTPNRPAGGRR